MKQKNVVLVLFSFMILTIAWMGFSFYHAAVTSTIDETLSIQIQPISPRFNEQTLDLLNKRTPIAPSYVLTEGIPSSGSPSGALENTPAAEEPAQTDIPPPSTPTEEVPVEEGTTP
jgi:hypothetical protein